MVRVDVRVLTCLDTLLESLDTARFLNMIREGGVVSKI
jgi:hypothetical protein